MEPMISESLWRWFLESGAALSREGKAFIFAAAEEEQYREEDLRPLAFVYYRQACKYPARRDANRTDDYTRESEAKNFFNKSAGLVRGGLSADRESGSEPCSRSLMKWA